ncbi:MAG: M14 metallopeptidase family protein [Bacteroidales bacterium]
MKNLIYPRLLLISFFLIFFCNSSLAQLKNPVDHFGFKPGSDKMLLNYESLIEYMEYLERESPRVSMERIGESEMGKPLYAVFFSSASNIKNLEHLKTINEELALNPELDKEERDDYIKEGKVFFLATLSMHSNEVGPSQAAPLIAHQLAETSDEDTLRWLDDVVYMMVPSHNPDGMNMIVDHYKEYKGTKYEGSSMPGVYHKYVGHNNNRDFVTISQKENQAISRLFSKEWFPQVMVEKHQMGSTGPRYFVPPNHDPIAENIDAGIWNWMGIFGMNMVKDMTQQGLDGVSQSNTFDNYWPGSTETCIWKNVIGFLTEAASADLASPIYVEPNELRVSGKGLSEYKKSINMAQPWDGGWWKLSDIVDYELSSTFSIIRTCADKREGILKFRNDICRKETNKGKEQAPFYYIFPKEQHDKSELVELVNLLNRHGVKRYTLNKNINIESTQFKEGDIVVPLAQPFRPFIKEVLEKQKYPVRRYTPEGEIIKPYDITSWSLPLHRGVKSYEINKFHASLENSLDKIEGVYTLADNSPGENIEAIVLPFENNESYKLAFKAMDKGMNVMVKKQKVKGENKTAPTGGFIIDNFSSTQLNSLLSDATVEPVFLGQNKFQDLEKLELPKTGLIETYMHDMDAGWTRYLFDSYHIPYEVIRPGEITEKNLNDYDLLIFPNSRKSVLLQGHYERDGQYRMSNYPPEFTKGMEKEGLQKVFQYINEGGKVISWGNSTELFMGKQNIPGEEGTKEEFQLPVSNVAEKYNKEGLFIPGSLVSLELRNDMDFTLGMPEKSAAFHRDNPILSTKLPIFDMDRRVIGRFADDKTLLSGYAEEIDKIQGEPAIVWLKKGGGEMLLFSYSPQFRGSTAQNYKLIFNALLFSNLK